MNTNLQVIQNNLPISLRTTLNEILSGSMTQQDHVNKIKIYEQAVSKIAPTAEIPSRHYSVNGLFVREIKVPKGVIVTGVEYKKDAILIIAKGSGTIFTMNGPVEVKAPFVVANHPGSKQMGYTAEEVVLLAVYPTNETDVNKVLEEFTVVNNASELYGGAKGLQALGSF